MKKFFPQSIKNIYHLLQAILANVWFGFPSRKLTVIGVTGTNGKTTTCQMITRILEEVGHRVGMASTINFKLGEKEWVNDTKFTTMSAWKVQKFIREAAQAQCEYLVLETSSHSLDQNRVWGVKYKTAVITNVTREHLDYHKTMEKYRAAKLRLFKRAEVAVVNLDMERPEEFLAFDNKEKYGYTTQMQNANLKLQSDNSKLKIIKAEDIVLSIGGTNYKLKTKNYKLNISGMFNVENALAATCVGLSEGISEEVIAQALEKIKGVPGRLESVPNDRGIHIIIDYAVTPDSLEKLYEYIETVRNFLGVELPSGSSTPQSRIISVFGSCGERDRGKRPIMGEIVSHYADYVIVTNEDPYGENPEQIINEVFAGVIQPHPADATLSLLRRGAGGEVKLEGQNAWRILDRRDAIKHALSLAEPGDIVVVTGKGAEETMAIGEKRIPWNDKKVISQELKKI